MWNSASAPALVLAALAVAVSGGLIYISQSEPGNMTTQSNEGVAYTEIHSPSGFVNSEPFQLSDYVGKKVILLDFMTYSCINCQRTFPYLNDWYAKYKDDGLIVVGIHTPEFAFERDINNVRNAAKQFGLEFPLVLDNDYATWAAYGNRYWPRKYLIDIHGNVVYDHIGEGAYVETENKIVELLNERKQVLNESGIVSASFDTPVGAPTVDYEKVGTPETYLGASRIQYLVNLPSSSCLSGSCSYSFSNDELMGYELQGVWRIDDEYALLEEGKGALRMSFEASSVNLVAGSKNPVTVEVYVDDVFHKEVTISLHTLYQLVTLEEYGSHILEIRFPKPGVSAFAFTFG